MLQRNLSTPNNNRNNALPTLDVKVHSDKNEQIPKTKKKDPGDESTENKN